MSTYYQLRPQIPTDFTPHRQRLQESRRTKRTIITISHRFPPSEGANTETWIAPFGPNFFGVRNQTATGNDYCRIAVCGEPGPNARSYVTFSDAPTVHRERDFWRDSGKRKGKTTLDAVVVLRGGFRPNTASIAER